MLTQQEQNNILKDFPNIELSYEKTIHKKVHYTLCLTIPKGTKCFVWFKFYKNNPYCFILKLNYKKNSITSFEHFNCCFNPLLCSGKGTIIFGTIFNINQYSFFNSEDIFFFKGHKLNFYNQYKKFNHLLDLVNNYTKQIIYSIKDIIIGLPIVSHSFNSISKLIQNLPYELYSIQYRHPTVDKTYLNSPYKSTKDTFGTFLVKATINTDIYELFYFFNKTLTKVDFAYIPDYKTSVLMNSLFRNIKENNDLDKLEESDDEEEFENINDDKFVDLNKSFKMKCKYLKKFFMWKPIEISDASISNNTNIILKKKF